MSVNVIFGSDAGATRAVASRIAKRMQGRAVDIKSATAADFEGCSLLILGAPTYGFGDLQADWEANLDKLFFFRSTVASGEKSRAISSSRTKGEFSRLSRSK